MKGVHEGNPVENIREAEAIYIGNFSAYQETSFGKHRMVCCYSGGGNTFRLLKCLYEESLLPEIRKRVLQVSLLHWYICTFCT